jgi:hypothetical protein
MVQAQESEATASKWSQYYGAPGYDNFVYSVIQTRDGGFAIAGTGAGGGWLVKTDSQGNMQWNQIYPISPIVSIVQTNDEGFAIINRNFELIKTDPYGNLQWSKRYEEGGYSYSLINTSDGGYVVAGGGFFVKTDSEGNMEWDRIYDGSIMSVVQTSDGGYASAGKIQNSYWRWNMFWLIKTDSSGEMQWNNTYGTKGKEALSLIQQKMEDMH